MTLKAQSVNFAMERGSNAIASSLLVNREFTLPADGWFQIVPIGEFPIKVTIDGKLTDVVQVCDAQAVKSMWNNFSGETLIDWEHFSHNPEKETRAAGWITAVQPRTDGLYAHIRLSNDGQQDLKGGNYRFISPEFDMAEHIEGNRWRPVRLSGAGLTNRPNLRTLAPLSNREAGGGNPTLKTTKQMDHKALLLKVLGLPETASDEDIQKAVDNGKPMPEATQEIKALNSELSSLRDTVAEADLAGLTLDKETKQTMKEVLMENREKGLTLLAALIKGQPAADGKRVPLFNRLGAKPPATGQTLEAAAKADEAHAAKLYNRAQEIMRSNKCGFSAAWTQAEAEIPKA
jgi:phage I-like protein